MSQAARVLITGARAPVALDLARQFAAAGWQVHSADSQPAHATASSRAVHAHHRLPPPRQAPAAFARAVAQLCRAQQIDLLLPTCEEVFYLAHGRDLLPPGVRLACPPLPLLRQLHSKAGFIDLARQAGMRTPATATVTGLEQARHWAAGRAVVLKPEFSRFGVEVRLFPQGIGAGAAPLDRRSWVVQDWLPGLEHCSYAVAERGRLLAHAVYRPAWRIARSASYYIDPQVPAGVQADIQAQTAALVAQLDYSGQIAFDWMIDAHGRAAVIECNPRGTSAIHLFAGSDALVSALAGHPGPCRQPSGQAAMLAPMMWAHAGPLSLWCRQWRNDRARADDVLARPGDRLPALAVAADLAHYAWQGLRQRRSMRALSTEDIEWDGSALPRLDLP